MSTVLALTLPLPVLLALVAALLVSLAMAVLAITLRRPAPIRILPDERQRRADRD